MSNTRKECDWPNSMFFFADSPGEHDPCYVVMPDRASLALNHHNSAGVDIARAKFIINACNAALKSKGEDIDMTNDLFEWAVTADELNKVRQQMLEVCYAIEKLPPHPIQTDLSVQASTVHQRLQSLARCQERIEKEGMTETLDA